MMNSVSQHAGCGRVQGGSYVKLCRLSKTRCRYSSGDAHYLNPSSFQLPPAAPTASPYILSFGNFGKGAVNGPGAATWDVGIFRSFIFRERLTLQLRGEYFNLLNRANFNNPTATISAGGFGSITGAGDPRIGQVALEVLF